MIRARAITVGVGDRVLLGGDRPIDLTVHDGEVLGIVGPNGSGKSTLLRALFRAMPLRAGRVEIDGDDLARLRRREISARIAFVGQHSASDQAGTAADEVRLGADARRGTHARGDVDRRVLEALALVDLVDAAPVALTSLSGGERQRVALARAAAQGADHVLLDEPTNHLDIRHRLDLLGVVRRIARTAVVVLHDLDLAARFCDRVILLDDGLIVAAGTAAEVLTPAQLEPVYRVRTTVHHDGGRLRLAFDPLSDSPLLERTTP